MYTASPAPSCSQLAVVQEPTDSRASCLDVSVDVHKMFGAGCSHLGEERALGQASTRMCLAPQGVKKGQAGDLVLAGAGTYSKHSDIPTAAYAGARAR